MNALSPHLAGRWSQTRSWRPRNAGHSTRTGGVAADCASADSVPSASIAMVERSAVIVRNEWLGKVVPSPYLPSNFHHAVAHHRRPEVHERVHSHTQSF